MSRSIADQNLLFGILAVQMDFITRDELVAAMNAWVLKKSRLLGDILVDQKAIAADTRALLTSLVAKHLELHANDPQQSLRAIGGDQAKAILVGVDDQDIQASLAGMRSPTPLAERSTLPPPLPAEGERFAILRPHAFGGLGEVCIARDRELNREVALKRMHDRHAADSTNQLRFQLEAEITGSLEHPGIVPVYGLGTDRDGRAYYAMRLIRGETLKEAILRLHSTQGRFDGARRLELRQLLGRFIAVCNAIEYAHSRGVVHRDIKPSNIMLGKFGETLVVDWGLAKTGRKSIDSPSDLSTLIPKSGSGSSETLPGSAVGTPAFMSPEQADGRLEAIGPASDVYSLGATLYMLLTGREPIESQIVAVVIAKAQAGDISPPRQWNAAIPRALDAICRKAMRPDPKDRYPSCLALASDLEHWLADEPVSAYRQPFPERMTLWTRRHRAATAALAAIAVAVIAAMGVGAAALSAKNRRIADHAAETTRQLYVARVNVAQRAWNENNSGRALELLESLKPEQTGGVDLRGWEWNRLWRESHSELRKIKFWGICLAFSADGKLLYSGDDFGTVGVWTADGGRQVRSFKAHPDRVTRIELSRDGKILVTSGRDGLLKVWDAESLNELHSMPALHAIRYGVDLSADGSLLAIPQNEQVGTVTLWKLAPLLKADSVASAQSMKLDSITLTGHAMVVDRVKFVGDGAQLVSCSQDGTIRCWDTAAGREIGRLKEQEFSQSVIAVSPDGRQLATGDDKGRVRLWNIATGELIRPIGKHASGVSGIDFSPDGDRLATSCNDSTIITWDLAHGDRPSVYRGHASSVSDVAFSPDGRRFASSSWDESIRIWDAASRQEPRTLPSTEDCRGLLFNGNGRSLLTTGPINQVTLLSDRGERRWSVEESTAYFPNSGCHSLSADHQRRILAIGNTEGGISLRDFETGRLIKSIKAHSGIITFIAVSPDGRHMATCVFSGESGLWSLPEGTKRAEWGGGSDAVGIAFSPDSSILATAGSGDVPTIRLWSTATGTLLRSFAGHTGQLCCAAFSSDGKRLFTGSADETLRTWFVDADHPARVSHAHAGDVTGLAVSPDGRRLASCSTDGTIRIRDIETDQEVCTLRPERGAIASVAFSPDGALLAAVTPRAGIQIWDARELSPELREVENEADFQHSIEELARNVLKQHVMPQDAIADLQRSKKWDARIRKAVIEHLQESGLNAALVNEKAWEVVAKSNAPPEEVQRAVRWAEAAVQAAPKEAAYVNTFGVALYRAGRYAEAAKLLTRSNDANKAAHSQNPADVAFLALSEFRLNHAVPARAHLLELQRLTADDAWKGDAEAQAFLQEALLLIGTASRRPVAAPIPDARSSLP